MIYKIFCPGCKSIQPLEEVMEGVVMSQLITIDADDDGVEIYNTPGEEPEYHEVFTNRFQCNNCGWIVRGENDVIIQTHEDLEEWFIDVIADTRDQVEEYGKTNG